MAINTIMGLFAKSPITPLLKHITTAQKCSELLIPFFESSFVNDWVQAEILQKQISMTEKDADKLKREIRINLPRGLFLPFDRRDMLDLIRQQDRVANLSKDIAGRVFGRQLMMPEVMRDDFIVYLKRCVDATKQAELVIYEFNELLETGFRGKEAALVEKMVHQLDLIEDDTDRLQVKLRAQLRTLEATLNPIDVIFLYKVLEWVGGIADQALRVGSRLELLLERN
jgi:predicted phosphate transport protein (TIGR00153 family)